MSTAQREMPLVSVCIPVYNGIKFVEDTIRSVLQQNFPRLEIIVQDNFSDDGTWELLLRLAADNPQLSVERNPGNIGMAPNWNAAVGRANGDYIILLSADDLLEPGFLDRCLEIFRRDKVGAVTTNHYFLRASGKSVRQIVLAGGKYVDFTRLILRHNPFSINFTLFSRETVTSLSRNGKLFASFLTCDLDLWLRLGLSGVPIFYLDEPLATYRVHGDNLSSLSSRLMVRHAMMTVLRNHKELRSSCPQDYRRKLAYFILKYLYSLLKMRPLASFDRKMFRVLCRETLSRY